MSLDKRVCTYTHGDTTNQSIYRPEAFKFFSIVTQKQRRKNHLIINISNRGSLLWRIYKQNDFSDGESSYLQHQTILLQHPYTITFILITV